MPTPEELALLLGETQTPTDFAEDRATAVINIVTQMAKSYTRGIGFAADGTPEPDIQAVILMATARLMANPSQIPMREAMGAIEVDFKGGLNSWSLIELGVLDRYRVTAQ